MAVLLSLPILVFAGWIRQTGGAPHRVDPSVVRFHAQQELPRQWDLGVAGGSGRSLPIGAMREGSECPCFLLLGDSHGMAISQVIDDAARHRGISGEASLRSAFVPLIGVWRSGSRSASTDWREHEEFDAWLNELVHRCKPRHIILCARWSAYLADEKTDSGFGDSFGIAPRAGQGMEAGSRSALMRQSLGIVLDLAERQDAQLWVLLEVPRQDITPQRRAIVGMAQGMIPLDGISSTAHEARVAEVRTVVESLKSDRLHVVDLSGPFFGSDGRSRTGRGGVSWYMDDDHISASGALELLSPMLDSVFERISEDCPDLQPGIPESD